MNIREWKRKKLLGMLGLADSQINPNDPKYTFLNDSVSVQETKLREYNAWYSGDSDLILNFYTHENMIGYNTEPYFDRNKLSYFWAVASTEGNVKRTHSGQPRNIVDTLVNIVGMPEIHESVEKVEAVLTRILKENKFKRMFIQEQLPLTLVEGWGCYKIDWDTSISDLPIIRYYRAGACDFIYKSNRIIAVCFYNYYADAVGKKYLLIETRRRENKDLIIEKELFALGNDDGLMPCKLSDCKQLKDVEPKLVVKNYSGLLAVPCIIYMDNSEENQGRSIFTGKIDLFDDLDQCLSQSANTVRKSTAKEYFNTNYLERDPETGMPIMPTAFDRSYVMYAGGRDGNGGTGLGEPVQATQPALNFQQYDIEAQSILLQIINGIISPATLGIDIAKKDNAEAQREKEKVTIFTRNTIIEECTDIIQNLCSEVLKANELMHTGEITKKDEYDVSVKFSEFADESFEKKAEVVLTCYNGDIMTPKMAVDKLYGDQLTESEKNELVAYMESKQQAAAMGGMPPEMQALMGASMGGMNPYDAQMQDPGAAGDIPDNM